MSNAQPKPSRFDEIMRRALTIKPDSIGVGRKKPVKAAKIPKKKGS